MPEPEAADATSSESVVDAELIEDYQVQEFAEMSASGFIEDGDSIDSQAAIEAPKPSQRSRRNQRDPDDGPRDAKTGPPSVDEWTGFFSRVVLRVVCDVYVNYAFRGVEDDSITDRDLDRLTLTDDERKTVVVPFAELSNKSKFMRKHGRMIVASGDAFNSVVVMGAWMARVQRIANKYRTRPQTPKNVRLNSDVNGGSSTASGNTAEPQFTANGHGSGGGFIPDGFSGPIYPGTG